MCPGSKDRFSYQMNVPPRSGARKSAPETQVGNRALCLSLDSKNPSTSKILDEKPGCRERSDLKSCMAKRLN